MNAIRRNFLIYYFHMYAISSCCLRRFWIKRMDRLSQTHCNRILLVVFRIFISVVGALILLCLKALLSQPLKVVLHSIYILMICAFFQPRLLILNKISNIPHFLSHLIGVLECQYSRLLVIHCYVLVMVSLILFFYSFEFHC